VSLLDQKKEEWARLGAAMGLTWLDGIGFGWAWWCWARLGGFGRALLVNVTVRLCVWSVVCVSEK